MITNRRIDSRSCSCSSVKMKCLRLVAKSGLSTSAVVMSGTVPTVAGKVNSRTSYFLLVCARLPPCPTRPFATRSPTPASRRSRSTSRTRATRSRTQLLDELIAALEAARDDRGRSLRGPDLDARPGVLRRRQPRRLRGRRAASCTSTSAPSGSRALFRLLGELGKPSICAANGHVLAGALGLALACDLIIAREGARFGTPEINVGRVPVHDHGADLPQRPAQEGERAAAARRADLGRGGGADRDRQPGRPAEEFDAGVSRVGAEARGASRR